MDEYVYCKYDPSKEDEYGWALCYCCTSPEYGIRVKRKKENHFFAFKCPRCGRKLGIAIKGTDSNCLNFSI